MKRIGITQRVVNVESYSERRDCLDQKWSEFIFKLGYIPIPLPNISPDKVNILIESLNLDAVILSGGNSIANRNSISPDTALERDEFESALISEVLMKNIPIIGVCRGMQMINMYFGGQLSQVNSHVATYHPITLLNDSYLVPELVNSFHMWGIQIDDLADTLDVIAIDNDGNIEALEHKEKNILGIMWHPEREEPFNILDINLLKKFLV